MFPLKGRRNSSYNVFTLTKEGITMLGRRMKRGILLVSGALGSMLVICLLVQSGAALWQSDTPEPAKVFMPERSLAFPMEIPGTTLVARHLIWYEGGYLEDGSHTYEANVAAILLENTGTAAIECARVILRWEGGAYVFDVDMLPPHMSVIVLERDRQPYEIYEWTGCSGVQKSGTGDWQGTVQVTESGIRLQITNPSDVTLHDVRIYFKDYLQEQDILVGGTVHSFTVGDIPPYTTVTAEPYRFVEGYSRIVRIDYQQGKDY